MNLDEIIHDFNRDAKGKIITEGDFAPTEKIPFTSVMLNYMTHGGIPTGKVVEFFGLESSGKTTTAFDVCKQFQAKGKKVSYFDLEQTFDPEWAKLLGVNVAKLVLVRPEEQSADKLLALTIDLVKSGEIGLVVIDSVPALVSQSEMDKDLSKDSMGGIGKLMSRYLRTVIPLLREHNCTLLLINQMRASFNPYGENYVVPGGTAIRFYASLILHFQKDKYIDADANEMQSSKGETAYGNVIQVRLRKSKCCRPDRLLTHYTLSYYDGILNNRDLIDLLAYGGYVQQAGSYYSVCDKDGVVMQSGGKPVKFQGKANLQKAMESDPALLKAMQNIGKEMAK